MSSFTFADHKTGGRFTAAADAIAAGHLNRAAGILAELADELNVEATQAGLLSEDVDGVLMPTINEDTVQRIPTPKPDVQPADLQMCARNVHSFGPTDLATGWRECAVCGQVNVSPPENNGFVDMSARQ